MKRWTLAAALSALLLNISVFGAASQTKAIRALLNWIMMPPAYLTVAWFGEGMDAPFFLKLLTMQFVFYAAVFWCLLALSDRFRHFLERSR
jgi:hypothetical protein